MNRDQRESLLVSALETIELKEARLLTWGLVDGALTRDEALELLDPLLDAANAEGETGFYTPEEVLAELVSRALVFELAGRYRSRMAEAVRLFYRLRQLFPKHAATPAGWQAAPTLVADYRFIWRRRRYPRRDGDPARFLDDLKNRSADSYAHAAMAALLADRGDKFGLASFQKRATERILEGLERGLSTGTLVSAGTGSGKTLAFYLPALSRVASHIRRDQAGHRWVKVLALYPRTELLKDQFSEVYAEARRLDGQLLQAGKRKILVGTYFGMTPQSAHSLNEPKAGWTRVSGGVACSYLRCPTEDCEGDLVWRDAERQKGTEALSCSGCERRIGPDEIVLTRDRMTSDRPDILFTTTEMLNQRMSDSSARHLFGLGLRASRPPELVLLDEVHTYVGPHGAQVAYLLRRWRKLAGKQVSFVGLSATLKDSARFFAQLCGLSENRVAEVTPRTGEMVSEGAEYLLALRGDPVSRTALLSTTIQATMLLSRVLDSSTSKSRGTFGERTFVFTDDIDVTNRLYFSILDAEGRTSKGAFNTQKYAQGGLATLRRPLPNPLRKEFGQDWEALTTIGHSLQAQDRKRVGRVMALDPGVDAQADVIVATASLEVGFNDPRVGAVIQHKAPRDVAQFLQRKGRAGRSRKMRPWTVVVLSDYGRDRLAYQNYDLLFDPELPVRTLPVGNRYIQRIQSVYATLDYWGTRLEDKFGTARPWTDLAGPHDHPSAQARQKALMQEVARTLDESAHTEALIEHLGRALRLPDADIAPLLWEYPRPLLTTVLPTALRRLHTGWRRYGEPGTDYSVRNSPLPEFAPPNLFTDLNLPEVRIVIPTQNRSTPAEATMPIGQSMREFAPGRVSRRYGLSHGFERHWVAPPLDDEVTQPIDLRQFYELGERDDWLVSGADGAERIPVYRPRDILVGAPPANVTDTSNARPTWRSQIVARRAGLGSRPPSGGTWEHLVTEVAFFMHNGQAPIEVRRMALGSEADIRLKSGDGVAKRFVYEQAGAPAAIGFSLSVDGLRIGLRLPRGLWSSGGEPNGPIWRALRTARYFEMAWSGDALTTVANPFLREWLAHVHLAALSNEAIASSSSLQEAAASLVGERADLGYTATLDTIFQSPIVEDTNGDAQDRLRQDIETHLHLPEVLEELRRLSSVLWTEIEPSWEPWLQRKFVGTVAAAVFQAIGSLCPEVDTEALVVDVASGPHEPDDIYREDAADAAVWVTETSPGGSGLIEEVARRYAEDPRRFFALVSATLRDNDFSLIDHQLQSFLALAAGPDASPGLQAAARSYRTATGIEATESTFRELREALLEAGLVPFHAFLVALANRILRPGSTIESDEFIRRGVALWRAEEERLGIELDGRVIAHRLSRDEGIDETLAAAGLGPPTGPSENWRFNAVYGLLWSRGAAIRQSGLRLYNPYADLPVPEPLLVRRHCVDGAARVELSAPDWQERLLQCLAASGAATLTCKAAEAERMADAFTFLATNPVQTDYLSVYGRLSGVRRVGGDLEGDVEVAEAPQ